MKFIATLLIFVLSISSTLYYLSFEISLFKDKIESNCILSSLCEKNKLEIIKTPLKNYKDDSESEIWNNGNLYDVAEKKLINDTMYIYVYRDKDEEDLLLKMKGKALNPEICDCVITVNCIFNHF